MLEEINFIIHDLLPTLLNGTVVTIELILISAPVGLLIGMLMAVGQIYGNRYVSLFCKGYVIFFRGTPTLVVLFIFYFGLPSLGIGLSAFASSILAFALSSGGYQSGYIEGALQSIEVGQMMAARSIGMSKRQAIFNIILPQAIRRAIPGCSNEIIYLVKYSSLAFMVTCVELTGAGEIVAAKYFKFTEVFIVVGIIYLVLVTVATKLLSRLEKKLKIPGLDIGKR